MNIIGLDIGTTTLSAVVADQATLRQIASRTRPEAGYLDTPNAWERAQDADGIARAAVELVEELSREYGPIGAIGLTGQMHGCLCVDEIGRAAGPFHNWQDGRGNLPGPEGQSVAAYLSQVSGYPLATGYGLVTHAWKAARGLVPREARRLTTIHGYVGMLLTGRKKPLLHVTDAASLGAFRVLEGEFDREAASRMGIDPQMLPDVTGKTAFLGLTPQGVPVTVGIGDNQASFLGAAGDAERDLLVNMGTGGQISALSREPKPCADVEIRPFVDGGFLLVGSPLCSGRAYALLEKFLRACAEMAGVKDCPPLYDKMNALAGMQYAHPLAVDTLFCGKRSDPNLRGGIRGLGEENFTPGHFVRGVLEGMAEEMYGLYRQMLPSLSGRRDRLMCSGNAIRLNPVLRDILAKRFEMPVSMPDAREEAATGAAIFARNALARKG